MIEYEKSKDKVVKFAGEKIAVKQYLDYQTKDIFVNLIIESLKDEDGIFVPNALFQDAIFTFGIFNYYTDMDVREKNSIELYNNCMESGLFDIIISAIPTREYNKMCDMIQKSIIDEKDKNSLLNVVKSFLETISEKIPDSATLQDTIGTFSEEIKKIKPSVEINENTKLKSLLQKKH
jgi:hypothetical protein